MLGGVNQTTGVISPPGSPSQMGMNHGRSDAGTGDIGQKYQVNISPSVSGVSGGKWIGVGATTATGIGASLDHSGIDVNDDSIMNQHGRVSNPMNLSDCDVPVKSSSSSLKKKLLIGGSFVVLAVVAVVLAVELMKHHGNDPVGANGVDANQPGGPAALQVGSGGSSSSSSTTGAVATASGSAGGGGLGGGNSSSSVIGSSSTPRSSSSGSTSGSSTTAASSSASTRPSSSSSSSTTGSGSYSSSSISGSTATAATSSTSQPSSSSATSVSFSLAPSSSSTGTTSTSSTATVTPPSSSSATPSSSPVSSSSSATSSSTATTASSSSGSSAATPSSSSSAMSSSTPSSSSTASATTSSSSVPSSSSATASSSSSATSTPSSSSTGSPSSSSAGAVSSSSASPNSSSSGGAGSSGGSSSAAVSSSSSLPSSSTGMTPSSSTSATGGVGASSSTGSNGPSLNFTRPGYTWYFNANASATTNAMNFLNSFRITEAGSPYSSAVMSTTDPMVIVTATGGNAKAFYLTTMQPHSLPGLQAGSLYRFSMTAQFSTYSPNYKCGTLKFLVYRPNSNTAMTTTKENYNTPMNLTVSWQTWNVTNDRYPAPTGVVSSVIASFDIQCTNFTNAPDGRAYQVGEWIQYSSTFNMTTDTADSIVGVYWNPTLQLGKLSGTEIWNFANFTMTLLPNQTQRAPDQPLQDGRSKVAQQPKQSTVPDFTDSTSTTLCPHLWPGLVAWENIISAVNESQPVLVLPDNTQILYGANSNPRSIWWQKIVIPVTSTLIFDDVPLVVHFENIMVLGAFRIGSANCRMKSLQQFFVHNPSLPAGNATGSDPQCYYCQGILSANNGQKGIAAPKPNVAYPLTSSIIELHSYQYTPTWTRLASSVFPGDIVIYVQEANNWEIGQTIGLVTSTWYDEMKPQNEQLVIAALSPDGKIIQLAKPAQFHHYAGPEYQSEVGLLTRRLTFSAYDADGSASSSRIGGHIMSSGQLRASGVELTKMGQRNILGRYPLHWHNAGDSNKYVGQGGQVIQDCSFHTTYFRCLSIHATHNATVTRSVGFDVIAHCFFIEDGIEIQNTLSYNLGASIHAILPMSQHGGTGWTNGAMPVGTYPIMPGTGTPGNIVPYGSGLAHASDAAPAAFYITNANNRFIGNAASGGFTGFSFVGVQQALGSISFGKYPGYNPRNQMSLQFEGNTAHSSGWSWEEAGGCIYAGGDLQYNDTLIGSNGQPGDFWYTNGRNDHGPVFFNHTKVWLCMKGLSHWGQNVYNAQPNATYWESHDSITSAAFFYGRIAHGYVNAHSANPSYQQWGQRGFLSYDKTSYLMLSDIEYANFKSAPNTDHPVNWILSNMANYNNYVTQPLDAVSRFSFTNCDNSKILWYVDPYNVANNNTIYSSPTRIEIEGAYVFNRIDYDGSLSSYSVNSFLANGLRGIKAQTSNLLQPNVLNTQDAYWPKGVPAVIGPANNLTSWWHADNSCMLNEQWMVYVCNMTLARRPIQIVWSTQLWLYPATLEPTSAALFTLYDRFWTGQPDPDFGLRFGRLALFGPGLTLPDRTQPVWNIYQVTGLSGMGWWWNFDRLGGSPNKFVIQPTFMYVNTSVIMAMPYPTGSNFTVEWRFGWSNPWIKVQPVPQVADYTSLVNSPKNTSAWTFDGSNFYIKMIAFPYDPTVAPVVGPTEFYWEDTILSGGPIQSKLIYYQWKVNCTGVTSRSICPVTTPTYPIVTQI